MYFVDSAHKTYQYSLRMASGGLNMYECNSVNKQVLIYTVH